MQTDGPEAFEANLRQAGMRPDDARALCRVLSTCTSRGQFGAAARTRDGQRLRNPRVVTVHDSEEGRYYRTRRPANDGRDWSILTPVDTRTLTTHLHALVEEITT